MMNKILAYGLSTSILLVLGAMPAKAQGEMDALKYSRNDQVTGSARVQGMASAFGALGGDFSSINLNPAGLGIYRSSEIVTGVSFDANTDNVDWYKNPSKHNSNRFNFDHIAYVGSWGRASDDISINFGFGARKVMDYHRKFKMTNPLGHNFSLADYAAATTPIGANSANFNFSGQHSTWLTDMAWASGWIHKGTDGAYQSVFKYPETPNGEYKFSGPSSSNLQSSETGRVWNYDFAFGMNIRETWYAGAVITYSDFNYATDTYYRENFSVAYEELKDNLELANSLVTDGSGFGLGLGVIARPTDFLRFGLSYYTPNWYWLRSSYQVYGSSYYSKALDANGNLLDPKFYHMDHTSEVSVADYQLSTPGRLVASAAALFGASGLLSFDYEYSNYGSMKLKDAHGSYPDNKYIKEDFGGKHSIRVGAEYKPISRLALRLGYAYSTNPVSDPLLKEHTKPSGKMIYTMGALPHYELPSSQYSLTGGIGFRFTPRFYGDLAIVYNNAKSHYYTFGSWEAADGFKVDSPLPATINRDKTRVAVTFGYKL